MERNTVTLNLTTDELSYLAELLNNEQYAANTNATIASSLITRLDHAQDIAHEDDMDEETLFFARTFGW